MPKYQSSNSREWIKNNFTGYFTVLYTPFLIDGEINKKGLIHNVESTMRLPGVGGISLHSIHQEFWTLTQDERKRVTDIVLQTVDGKMPVIAGVSDPSARNVIDLAKHASTAGADAVMVWPPYYGPKTAAGVRKFYESVASQIDIGIFAYSTTLTELGFYLTPDIVESMLDIENLVGLQNSTMNFSQYAAMMSRVGDKISVSTSLEEYFLFGKIVFNERTPNFMMGSSRPILIQSQSRPLCGDFIETALNGDYLRAGAILREIMTLAEKIQSRYFAKGFHHVSLFKEISGLLGFESGGVRAPDSSPSLQELEECIAVLKDANVLASDDK